VIPTRCGCQHVLVERERYENDDNKKIDQGTDGAQSFRSAISFVSKASNNPEEVIDMDCTFQAALASTNHGLEVQPSKRQVRDAVSGNR